MASKSLPDFHIDIEDLKPLREKIASNIRNRIIEGTIKPGERLTENDVANILGVSRTPLREAFFQLEAEGFVTFTPRKGAIVSDLSLTDADETYAVKTVLEEYAAGLAVGNVTDKLIKELTSINKNLEKQIAKSKKDINLIFDLNAKFHQTIVEASENQKLTHMLLILRKQTQRYNYIYLSLLSRLENSICDHVKIIEALREKDAERVKRLVREHSEGAHRILCDYMKSKQ
jgi:DNA-binding GntR family transcriptional regulator